MRCERPQVMHAHTHTHTLKHAKMRNERPTLPPTAPTAPSLPQSLNPSGISDDDDTDMHGIRRLGYKHIVTNIAEIRLSEGASGAFMFFAENPETGSKEYMIKTVSRTEATTLHTMLPQYQR